MLDMLDMFKMLDMLDILHDASSSVLHDPNIFYLELETRVNSVAC